MFTAAHPMLHTQTKDDAIVVFEYRLLYGGRRLKASAITLAQSP